MLINTLERNGVHNEMLRVLKDMYKDTNNVIRLNGELSSEFVSEQGLMQGHTLSPTLFSMFINGLLNSLNSGDGIC